MRQEGLASHVPDEQGERWQRVYFQGRDADGNPVDGHQTKLHVRPFRRPDEE